MTERKSFILRRRFDWLKNFMANLLSLKVRCSQAPTPVSLEFTKQNKNNTQIARSHVVWVFQGQRLSECLFFCSINLCTAYIHTSRVCYAMQPMQDPIGLTSSRPFVKELKKIKDR